MYVSFKFSVFPVMSAGSELCEYLPLALSELRGELGDRVTEGRKSLRHEVLELLRSLLERLRVELIGREYVSQLLVRRFDLVLETFVLFLDRCEGIHYELL